MGKTPTNIVASQCGSDPGPEAGFTPPCFAMVTSPSTRTEFPIAIADRATSFLGGIATALRSLVLPETNEVMKRLLGRINAVDTVRTDRIFESELSRLGSRLLSYARSLTREADAAQDLVRDTVLLAWKGRNGFARGTNFKA